MTEQLTLNTQETEKRLTDIEILLKIKELKKVQKQVEDLNAKISFMKEDIKNEMVCRNIELLKIDVYKISYATVISDKFNNTKFKKEHIDLYNSYLYKSESKRFDIR